MKHPRKAPKDDYAWHRAGLEIKVCPIAMVEDHLVLFRRVDGPQFFLYKGHRQHANNIARAIAVEISQAIDRELEASFKLQEKLTPGVIRDRPSRFNEVVQAMLEKPPPGFGRGRERRTS